MKMPFGKHSGREIADIETAYLQWVIDTVDESRQDPLLLRSIQWELSNRDGGISKLPIDSTEPVDYDVALALLEAGRRTLALTDANRASVNFAYDWLTASVRQAKEDRTKKTLKPALSFSGVLKKRTH